MSQIASAVVLAVTIMGAVTIPIPIPTHIPSSSSSSGGGGGGGGGGGSSVSECQPVELAPYLQTFHIVGTVSRDTRKDSKDHFRVMPVNDVNAVTLFKGVYHVRRSDGPHLATPRHAHPCPAKPDTRCHREC